LKIAQYPTERTVRASSALLRGDSHGDTPQNVPTVLLTEKSCSARSLRFNSLDEFRLSMSILVFVPFLAPLRKEART